MFITAIIFFLILSILVLIHEFGHYAVARLIGVHVEEFGLGLPPRIFGRTIGKTLCSVEWLARGGFVKLAGEDEIDSPKSKVRSPKSHKFCWARSQKERATVLVAGVTMLCCLALPLFTHAGVLEPSGRVKIERFSRAAPPKPSASKKMIS